MRRRSDRRTRLRSAAALLVLVLGVGSLGGGAAAQTANEDLIAQFGGYELNASGQGIQLTYDIPGALPVSPIVSLGLPEAQARQSSGSGYALASLAYPGPLIADIGAALQQGGTDAPIPPYPIRTQAFFPGNQTEERSQTLPGADMVSITDAVSSQGSSRYTGAEVPGVVDLGGVEVVARTELVEGQAVGRTRVHLADVSLLAGLIRIESVVTDIVATSNGETAATEGTTTVDGVTLLGLAASIDGDGLHLAESLPAPSPLDPVTEPITGPLRDALKPVIDGVAPIADQLSSVIQQVLGAQHSINDLLEAVGIQIRVLDPNETVEDASATIVAGGLAVSIVYPGDDDPRLAQLLSLIPSDQLPAEAPQGVPMSPQALANLMKDTHIATFSIASAAADALASPAFVFEEGDFGSGDFGGGGDFGSGDFGLAPIDSSFNPGTGGFQTPVPNLPESGLLENSGLLASGAAIPLSLILITIFTAPLWAAASQRFANATLGGAAAGCPVGKDVPTAPPGSPSRA